MAATLLFGEVDLNAQRVHAIDPVKFLKVPAGHGKQVPPSGPVAPTSHLQSVSPALD